MRQVQELRLNISMDNPNQLSVTDLAVIKNIIDLASTRGAFRANELRQIGEVYDKLSAFLDDLVAMAEAQRSADAQPQGDLQNVETHR